MSLLEHEYDIVIAGGGASACVVAGRLAAADSKLKILVLEAGPHTQEGLDHVQPARYASHLVSDSKTMKFITARPSESLDGRAIVVPAGQCLGGGSSVNFTMYTRAAASDYDDWVTKHGNPGWGYKDLLPYLRKFETYQVEPGLETHGYSGPLGVSGGGIYGNVGKDFLDVGAAYDRQRGFTTDVNGFVSGCNEYGVWPKWINRDTGRRSDTAHNYIYNQTDNKNLFVLTGYFVKRVIFENKRAVGVECLPNTRVHPSAPQEILTARATRLVVVSGGSMGSPLILERSGIGSKDILGKLGVESIVDLPGVGDKYQDHLGWFPPYFASDDSLTLDGIIRGEEAEVNRWTSEWLDKGTGLMASNGLDTGLKLRPTEEELKVIGPLFEKQWMEVFADAPDKSALYFGPLAAHVGATPSTPIRKYFSIIYLLLHPASMGHIHITSGEDVTSQPDFDPGYLTKHEDLSLMVWGYKRSREFARRMACYRGELSAQHPKFKEGSQATCKDDAKPVPIDTPDIVWTAEDDKAIEEHTKANVISTWHSLGTCAMKPRENGGVVDTRLNVYGVENLKVADLSIAPGNVASNTYSSALAIAERAAAIIGEDFGIKGV